MNNQFMGRQWWQDLPDLIDKEADQIITDYGKSINKVRLSDE